MLKKNLISVLGVVLFVGVLAVTSFAYPSSASAASNYYLTIDGIKGGSTASGHKDSIEVASWSFGASNPSTVCSGGASSGKVSISSFNFMKRVDKSSPALFTASQTGNHIPNVSLAVRLMGSSEYLTVKMQDVVVSSYSMSSGGDRPTESVSFTYQKIEISWPTSLTADSTGGSTGSTTSVTPSTSTTNR